MLRLTFNPVLKKLGKGFLSYVRNSALFDNGDMAIWKTPYQYRKVAEWRWGRTPICLR